MTGVLDDNDAIDEHRRAGAGRVLVRRGVGGAVLEIGRIEDRDVGLVAFSEQSPVAQPRTICGATLGRFGEQAVADPGLGA